MDADRSKEIDDIVTLLFAIVLVKDFRPEICICCANNPNMMVDWIYGVDLVDK